MILFYVCVITLGLDVCGFGWFGVMLVVWLLLVGLSAASGYFFGIGVGVGLVWFVGV